MAKETAYEVQIKRGGAWTICETFKDQEKGDAVALAKEIFEEEAKIEAVKVVMEVRDEEADTFSDSVVFRESRDMMTPRTEDGQGGKQKAGSSKKDNRSGGKEAGKKGGKNQTFGLSGFVFRFAGGVLASFVIAGLCAWAAVEFLGGKTVFGIDFVGSAKTWLLIGSFAVAFLICVSVVAYLLMKQIKVKKSASKTSAKPRTARRPRPPVRPQMSLFAVAAFLVLKPFKVIAEAVAIVKLQDNKEKAAASEAPAGLKKKPKKPQDESLSPEAEKLKNYLMTFLKEGLDGGKADKETMDNFNRFGVSLFLAGASEVLTAQGKINPGSQIKILVESILVLRFKKSHALNLAKRYEEYLMADSRYMQMFQAGRAAIAVYLSDHTAAPRLLDEALGEWNKPKAVEPESGPTTVMFANWVRATGGDEDEDYNERASELHNRIVEDALGAHSGLEVKRLPDGNMATFSQTSDGVSAAIEMQKKTALSNQGDDASSLQMKIGINAGLPNDTESDLFGTVVRFSAQIVERAAAGQIYVSEMVKGFCKGANFKFQDRGAYELPGAEDPVKIYEVFWNGGTTDGPVAGDPPAEEKT